jgi:hypothetical protein
MYLIGHIMIDTGIHLIIIVIGIILHGIIILGIGQTIITGIIITILTIITIIIIGDLKIEIPIMVIEIECHQTPIRQFLSLNQ